MILKNVSYNVTFLFCIPTFSFSAVFEVVDVAVVRSGSEEVVLRADGVARSPLRQKKYL